MIPVLAACLLFASCGAEEAGRRNPDTGETAEVESTKDRFEDPRANEKDGLPDSLDLGGETFVILSRGSEVSENGGAKPTQKNMYEDELYVGDLNNDVLNDAIYNRTIAVEERLNCTLEFRQNGGDTSWTSNNFARQDLERALNSGDNEYQIYANSAAPTVSDSELGWFYDLLTLDYLDFDRPWWYDGFREKVEIMGRLYCADGSLSLSTLRSACAVFFNKKIAEDYHIGDLYETVNAGDWTIDLQSELVAGIYQDLNGNSDRDGEDLYGFVTVGYWVTDTYLSGFDINILSRDEDGLFFFDCDYEKMTSAHEKIYNLYWKNPGTYQKSTDTAESITLDPARFFAQGNALFMTSMLFYAEDGETLRSMTDEYGILPVPKYNRQQKDYFCNPYECATVFAIPVSNPDPDSAAAVLEALNAETYRHVITAYSDIALKGKYLNDPQSRQMFDRIINGMTVNAGHMYCYQIGEFPQWVWRYPIDWDDDASYVKKYTSFSHKIPRLLEIMNEEFEKLDS